MNTLHKLTAGLVLGVAAMVGGTASAATICTGCDYQDGATATFLGTHNPTTTDQSTFTNTQMAPGDFVDYWLFELNPAGTATVNAIFNPFANVSDFQVDLYGACTGIGALGAPGSAYNGGGSCAFITSGSGAGGFSDIGFTNLAAGIYLFVVSGTVIDGPVRSPTRVTSTPSSLRLRSRVRSHCSALLCSASEHPGVASAKQSV